ncbi:hypothetical protein BJ508DRAFT_34906 [Ascobolus immersus RN42]|uniref:Uncharacterized protein n=1 Tax=Ascobolus immersus RN42 TaxID=1160509 RepID=A0A3N4HRQ2_ASCIM|nr:hypothetical protein BJ508DRAFT_34906 [Ascobolus immersus RN42]
MEATLPSSSPAQLEFPSVDALSRRPLTRQTCRRYRGGIKTRLKVRGDRGASIQLAIQGALWVAFPEFGIA